METCKSRSSSHTGLLAAPSKLQAQACTSLGAFAAVACSVWNALPPGSQPQGSSPPCSQRSLPGPCSSPFSCLQFFFPELRVTWHYIVSLPPLERQLHYGRDFCLFCSLLYILCILNSWHVIGLRETLVVQLNKSVSLFSARPGRGGWGQPKRRVSCVRKSRRGMGCPRAMLRIREAPVQSPTEESQQVRPPWCQEDLGSAHHGRPSHPSTRFLLIPLGLLGSEIPGTCFPEDSVALQISQGASWREVWEWPSSGAGWTGTSIRLSSVIHWSLQTTEPQAENVWDPKRKCIGFKGNRDT